MLQSKWPSHYSWPRHAFNFRHSQGTFLLCRMYRPGLRSKQANIQSAAGALSPSDKEAWHETDHSPPLSAQFNNTSSLLPFAHKSSGPILRNYFIGIRPKCGADTVIHLTEEISFTLSTPL